MGDERCGGYQRVGPSPPRDTRLAGKKVKIVDRLIIIIIMMMIAHLDTLIRYLNIAAIIIIT